MALTAKRLAIARAAVRAIGFPVIAPQVAPMNISASIAWAFVSVQMGFADRATGPAIVRRSDLARDAIGCMIAGTAFDDKRTAFVSAIKASTERHVRPLAAARMISIATCRSATAHLVAKTVTSVQIVRKFAPV